MLVHHVFFLLNVQVGFDIKKGKVGKPEPHEDILVRMRICGCEMLK